MRLSLQFIYIGTNRLYWIQCTCSHDVIATMAWNPIQLISCDKWIAVAIALSEQPKKGSFTQQLRQWQTFVGDAVAMNGYATYSAAALLSHITIAKVYVDNATCYYATYSLRENFVIDAALVWTGLNLHPDNFWTVIYCSLRRIEYQWV